MAKMSAQKKLISIDFIFVRLIRIPLDVFFISYSCKINYGKIYAIVLFGIFTSAIRIDNLY